MSNFFHRFRVYNLKKKDNTRIHLSMTELSCLVAIHKLISSCMKSGFGFKCLTSLYRISFCLILTGTESRKNIDECIASV